MAKTTRSKTETDGDIFDRIAGHIDRIRRANSGDPLELTVTLDAGAQSQLALRVAQASRAFGIVITPEQYAHAALLRGLRMRRL